MAWGSKEYLAKSNATGDGLTPAVAAFTSAGAPVMVAPSGATVELTGGTAATTAAEAAISAECSSGGVIWNAISAYVAAQNQ